MKERRLPWLLICLILLVGCNAPEPIKLALTSAPRPVSTEIPAPTSAVTPSPGPVPAGSPAPGGDLLVTLLYPKTGDEIEMGLPLRFIAQVKDAQGHNVDDAQVTITVRDSSGHTIGTIPAPGGGDGAYRASWPVPHRTPEGTWRATVAASWAGSQGSTSGNIKIKNSTSEVLLSKYGFWLDAPNLKGITPQIMGEKGDAHDGMVRWGGGRIGPHVYPENWLEINWREGDFKLDGPGAVRRFLLGDLGDLGFTPIRDIGPFNKTKFKQWDAWQVEGRGQFSYNQVQWMIFYVPEVNKTFSLGTDVVLPPPGIDPHAALRESFAVYPELQANGVAPEPLPKLRPGPELSSPALGAVFEGTSKPVVLQWQPDQELAPDEYYEVAVDYAYKEGNPTLRFNTREAQLTLPESLYHTPNCRVFNWQVSIMRQTGTDADGKPVGVPVTHNSLYWFVIWKFPVGQEPPWPMTCQNQQF